MNNINRNIFLAALMGISFGLFLKIYPQWSLYNAFLEANVIIAGSVNGNFIWIIFKNLSTVVFVQCFP